MIGAGSLRETALVRSAAPKHAADLGAGGRVDREAVARLPARYLSASIWSASGCCRIETASPLASAGPWAFSRIVSSRPALNLPNLSATRRLVLSWLRARESHAVRRLMRPPGNSSQAPASDRATRKEKAVRGGPGSCTALVFSASARR